MVYWLSQSGVAEPCGQLPDHTVLWLNHTVPWLPETHAVVSSYLSCLVTQQEHVSIISYKRESWLPSSPSSSLLLATAAAAAAAAVVATVATILAPSPIALRVTLAVSTILVATTVAIIAVILATVTVPAVVRAEQAATTTTTTTVAVSDVSLRPLQMSQMLCDEEDKQDFLLLLRVIEATVCWALAAKAG